MTQPCSVATPQPHPKPHPNPHPNPPPRHHQITKLFKKGGVTCQASSDMVCSTNATTLALRCAVTSGGGVSAAPPLLGALLAALAAVAAAQLLVMH